MERGRGGRGRGLADMPGGGEETRPLLDAAAGAAAGDPPAGTTDGAGGDGSGAAGAGAAGGSATGEVSGAGAGSRCSRPLRSAIEVDIRPSPATSSLKSCGLEAAAMASSIAIRPAW